jgi:nicotinamide-nucleotide amidase
MVGRAGSEELDLFSEIDDVATLVNERLQGSGQTLVLAESCTAGLIAASLARIPGASLVLAGSAVVYQVATKTQWIDVKQQTVTDAGVVSSAVATEMAEGVLRRTPHATCSIGITGHLGPDAPDDLDGVAWVSVAAVDPGEGKTARLLLDSVQPADVCDNETGRSRRLARQQAAVLLALRFLLDWLPSDNRDSQ